MTAKTEKKLATVDIPSIAHNSQSGAKRIFINSHVMPSFGRLLHCGRAAVNEKKIAECWIDSNEFLVKVVDDCGPIEIKTIAQLNALRGNDPSPVNLMPNLNAAGKCSWDANESNSPKSTIHPN